MTNELDRPPLGGHPRQANYLRLLPFAVAALLVLGVSAAMHRPAPAHGWRYIAAAMALAVLSLAVQRTWIGFVRAERIGIALLAGLASAETALGAPAPHAASASLAPTALNAVFAIGAIALAFEALARRSAHLACIVLVASSAAVVAVRMMLSPAGATAALIAQWIAFGLLLLAVAAFFRSRNTRPAGATTMPADLPGPDVQRGRAAPAGSGHRPDDDVEPPMLVSRQRAREEIDALIAAGTSSLSAILITVDGLRARSPAGARHTAATLQSIGLALSRATRASDLVGSWGRWSFLVVAPDTPLWQGHRLADRCREQLIREVFGPEGNITASFGLASCRPGERSDELLARATAAMRKAQKRGVNRVESSTA